MKLTVACAAVILQLLVATGSAFAFKEPGDKAPLFSLKDVSGKEHSLAENLKNKAVVIMFIATQCPVSNAYNERMVKLNDDYSGKGIVFLGINANKQESTEEIKDHSSKHGFAFTVLKDVENRIADEYGAQFTPEVYLIDPAGVVRYHGRIDDSRDTGGVTSQDLRAALDAILSGKAVTTPSTKAFGCSIKRVKKQL